MARDVPHQAVLHPCLVEFPLHELDGAIFLSFQNAICEEKVLKGPKKHGNSSPDPFDPGVIRMAMLFFPPAPSLQQVGA